LHGLVAALAQQKKARTPKRGVHQLTALVKSSVLDPPWGAWSDLAWRNVLRLAAFRRDRKGIRQIDWDVAALRELVSGPRAQAQ
jgi:hypothetical protein